MSEKSKQKKWRSILTYVTLAALVILIIALHKQILNTIEDLKNVDIYWLLMILPIEALNYHAQTKVYEAAVNVLKQKLSYKFLYRLSLELNFIQTIFPSGGLSGLSYINVRLKPKGISSAQATIIQMYKLMLVFAAFIVLMVIGVFLLALGGKANDVVILISSSIITLTVVLSAAVVFIVSSRNRIDVVFTYLTRQTNRLIKIFRPSVEETINVERARRVFNELHENYLLFKEDYRAFVSPFLYALLANLTEVAAIYVVYIAFGHWENPGAIIIAYAVANFAGTLSIFPGGIGVYETLMTLVLVAVGVPASLSIPVTIMYRVISIFIQLVPGYVYYQKAIRPGAVDNA